MSQETRPTMSGNLRPFRDYKPQHFLWDVSEDGRVATLTLNRPERKNPLTFDSYAEMRDLFRDLVYASDIRTVILIGAGGKGIALPLHLLLHETRIIAEFDATLQRGIQRNNRECLAGRRRKL